jgi:hypothetical protein
MNSECNEIRDLIVDSMTGPLPAQQARHLDEHLQNCLDCQRYLDAIRHEDLLLGRLAAQVTEDTPARTEQLLHDLSCHQSKRIHNPTGWRKIMTSRMTKLAVAALIIAAVVLGAHYFDGTPVKAVEFSEVTKAMSEVPWMHMTSSGGFPDDMSIGEQWIGFESRIQVHKDPDGQVSFASEKDHKQFTYNPGAATITVSYVETFPLDVTSPAALVESMHKALTDQGAEVVVKAGKYKGRRAQVQEFRLQTSGPDGAQTRELTLYIDPDSKVLCGAALSGIDASGKLVMAGEIMFDYPRTGPQSIYDLGVPRDAKIVSNMPGLNVHSTRERYRQVWGETSKECGVMERYWQARDEATREYLAVIAHNTAVNITDAMNMVDVDYKSGPRHRQEHHSVFESGQPINDEVWAKSKQQLGDTFESLLAWSRDHYAGRGRIDLYLYDGQYDSSVTRENDNWGPPSKHYHPEGSIAPEIALGNLAWPEISPPARVIEDDYATEHGLICFECLQQGHLYNGKVSLPGRLLYYLDPAWDYMCRRKVTEWRPDAPWQKDENWLNGVDPTQVPNGSIAVTDITEAFQAPNGHWYPKSIVERQTGIRKDYRQAPLRTDTIRRVHLDLSPEFPEGIFDIDKLPGQ